MTMRKGKYNQRKLTVSEYKQIFKKQLLKKKAYSFISS